MNTAKESFSVEVAPAMFNKMPSCNAVDPLTPGHVPAAIVGALGLASGSSNGGKSTSGGKPSAPTPDSALGTAPTPRGGLKIDYAIEDDSQNHNKSSRSEGQDAMENNMTAAPDKSNTSSEKIAGGSIGFRVENDAEQMKRVMFARTKDSMLSLLINNAKITQESYLVMRKVSVPGITKG